jgi:molybdate transport system ATP-binding protein
VLLFDEPMASVDQRLKRRILPYLIRALEHFAIPSVYVSHSHEEVTQMARQILVLNRGRTVAFGDYLKIIDIPEVYGVFSREGVDNALQGTVVSEERHQGFSRVEVSGVQLLVPPLGLAPGSAVRLNVKANDIILATDRPQAISTRNVLKGRVTRVAEVEEILLAHINVGCEFLVELTPSAVKELNITSGAAVWVLIKTNAISVSRISPESN